MIIDACSLESGCDVEALGVSSAGFHSRFSGHVLARTCGVPCEARVDSVRMSMVARWLDMNHIPNHKGSLNLYDLVPVCSFSVFEVRIIFATEEVFHRTLIVLFLSLIHI